MVGAVVFTMLGIFVLLTVVMAVGLWIAKARDVAPAPYTEAIMTPTLWQAMYHMLTASMKGLVALSGLEAMSNGIQFVITDDAGIVKWGKQHLPRLQGLWEFYSGKSGIGRLVQTSFLFYGGITTAFLAYFAIHFNVFDGTLGRSLVANLSFIAFTQLPGGQVLYLAYQILAVALLAAASMTAFQDLQATEWRDVAIGEIPEIIVYRDKHGTFTRSVTSLHHRRHHHVHRPGETSLAVPFYGVGVFMPITVMGLAIRQHVLKTFTDASASGGVWAPVRRCAFRDCFCGTDCRQMDSGRLGGPDLIQRADPDSQPVLISPIGFREPRQIHRIVRERPRVQGAMASIVEWQSLRMQEYRYSLLVSLKRFFERFGVHQLADYQAPAPAGEYRPCASCRPPRGPLIPGPVFGERTKALPSRAAKGNRSR